MESCVFLADSDSGDFYVNSRVKAVFDSQGFVLVKHLLSPEEVQKLRSCFEGSEDIQKHAYGRSDGKNRVSKLCVWNVAGDDISGVVARCVVFFFY